MINLESYLMGRDDEYPVSEELLKNAARTIGKANTLMLRANIVVGLRSGYRPAAINAKIPGASPTSKHITCEAIDLIDNDGKLKSWCLKNITTLEDLSLWMESPEFTPHWVHLQIIPPQSGHRIFIP